MGDYDLITPNLNLGRMGRTTARNDLKASGIIYKLEKTFRKSRLLEIVEKLWQTSRVLHTDAKLKALLFGNAFSILNFGGAKGDRTPDLLNAIQALSHLSYGPTQLQSKSRVLLRGCQAKSQEISR